MSKKLNLKKLLATASAFAVITGASVNAMGANITITPATLGIKTTLKDSVTPGLGGSLWTNTSKVTFSADDQSVDFDADNMNLGGTDNGGNSNTRIIINKSAITLSGVTDSSVLVQSGGGVTTDFAINKDLTVEAGALPVNVALVTGDVTSAGDNVTIDSAGGKLTVTAGKATSTDTVASAKVSGTSETILKAVTGELEVTGDKAVVTAESTGSVKMATNAKVTVTGNSGNVDGAGTLTLLGKGDTGIVGGTDTVTKIIVKGDRTFTQAITSNKLTDLVLEGADAKVKLDTADLGATNVTTTETDRSNHIIVKENQTITGNIGTSDNPLGDLIVDSTDKWIEIATTDFFASLKTNTDGENLVIFKKDGARAISIGDTTNAFSIVNFVENAEIEKNIYSRTIAIPSGKTAKMGGMIKAKDLLFQDNISKAIISDEATLDIDGFNIATGDGGNFEFVGGSTILQKLGSDTKPLTSVKFANDATKTQKLGVDIYSRDVYTHKTPIELTKNTTIYGNLTADSSNLKPQGHKLIVNEDITFKGNNILAVIINADGTNGQLVASSGKNITFDSGAAITVDIDDNNTSNINYGVERKFLDKNGATITGTANFNVKGNNAFVVWTKNTSGIIAATPTNNSKPVLTTTTSGKVDATDTANINLLSAAKPGTDAARFLDQLSEIIDIGVLTNNPEFKEKVAEAIKRLPVVTTVTDAIENSTVKTGAALSGRVLGLHNSDRELASEVITGVSAGECDSGPKYGVWISPFYSDVTQKERKGSAGYKNKTFGAGIGIDTKTNEDTMIGVSIAAYKSDLKHKDFKSGDKTDVNSTLFSIYGMRQITNSAFLMGSATVGRHEVKNKELRVSSLTDYEIASAKYHSTSYGADAFLGYNMNTKMATVTPMFGVRYIGVNNSGYTQSGTTFQNASVTSNKSNKFEVIAGARVSAADYKIKSLMVTREIHAFVNHDVIHKNGAQTIKISGLNLEGKPSEPQKTIFNVGLGVNATMNMMEYGIGYDANIANKYIGHTGTLRLRVNF